MKPLEVLMFVAAIGLICLAAVSLSQSPEEFKASFMEEENDR